MSRFWFPAAMMLMALMSPAARGQLMSPAKEKALRALFPRVDSPVTQAILDDPNLILYTEEEMPAAYQQWDGDLKSVHSPDYNISAGSREKSKGHGGGGNGNVEFPWSAPGGTHRCRNVFAMRFLQLPVKDGKRLAVAWYRQRLQGDQQTGYAWVFPQGTVFGEVLCMRAPDGRWHAFELRTRRRVFEGWEPDAFRPFPTAQRLAERIKELRSDWDCRDDLVRLVEHLQRPAAELHMARLADTNHPRRDFDQWMGVDTLPAIADAQLVAELLEQTEFRSALGEYWRIGKDQRVTYAPTTQADWHIVPRNYDAGFIAVDQQSCARCHSSANSHVSRFDAFRDWYGRVRGSDRILSFHPFALASISDNGIPRAVRMRAELSQAGLLERFDPNRHPHPLYHRIGVE